MTRFNMNLIYGLVFGALVACGSALGAPTLPDFSAATFEPGQPVDNLYFPLTEGLTRTFTGQRIDGGQTVLERFELATLGPGPIILGVQTIAQRDRAFENNVLVEDTLDYYAQDAAGNVWYFGEDVTNFLFDSTGNPAGMNNIGTWRAGVNNGLPGFIMPADLTIGFNYYQEYAPIDGAVDQATTIAVGETLSIDIGKFSNVLKVLETSELKPGLRELKYYAPERGLVFVEEGVNADLMDPEFTIELTRISTKNDDDEEDADENEDDKDAASMDDPDDDSPRDRDINGNHEAAAMEDMERDDRDADAESHEMDDSDAKDETPSGRRASKLRRSVLAGGAASASSRDHDLAPQIIDRALKAADSTRGAMVLANMQGSLLAGATILENSLPNFSAADLLGPGASWSSSAQVQSAVPEPSALWLTVLASLAVSGWRLRVRLPGNP